MSLIDLACMSDGLNEVCMLYDCCTCVVLITKIELYQVLRLLSCVVSYRRPSLVHLHAQRVCYLQDRFCPTLCCWSQFVDRPQHRGCVLNG